MLSDLAVTGDAAVVADQHPAHRHTLRAGDGDRQGPRVHPAQDRRSAASAGAAGGGPRGGDVAAVAAQASAPWRRSRASIAVVVFAAFAHGRAADQQPLRVPGRRRSCASSAAPACSAGHCWPRAIRSDAGGRSRRLIGRGCARGLHPGARSNRSHRATGQTGCASTASKAISWRSSHGHAMTLACGPVGVPNHAPIPLLALYLKTSPARIVSARGAARSTAGRTSTRPARGRSRSYVLDPHDPHLPVSVPAGLHAESQANRSWRDASTRCPQADHGPCTPRR